MEASTDWKTEGGHTLQFHSLGTGDPGGGGGVV